LFRKYVRIKAAANEKQEEGEPVRRSVLDLEHTLALLQDSIVDFGLEHQKNNCTGATQQGRNNGARLAPHERCEPGHAGAE
jgi:hypothetical protein